MKHHRLLILLSVATCTSGFGPASYAACVAAGMAACAAGATTGAAVTAGVGAGAAVAAFTACEQGVVAACVPLAACFSEDTEIYVSENKTAKISTLKRGDVVMTASTAAADEELLTMKTRVIANVLLNGKLPFSFVDITVQDGGDNHAKTTMSVTEDHVLITHNDRHIAARDVFVGLTLFPHQSVINVSRGQQAAKYVLITSYGSVLLRGDVVVSTVCEGSLTEEQNFSEAVVDWQKLHANVQMD